MQGQDQHAFFCGKSTLQQTEKQVLNDRRMKRSLAETET